MNLIFTYSKYALINLTRNRSAMMFGMLFPLLLFLTFGHPETTNPTETIASFVVFCNYAVQTVMFLSLGMAISMKRSSEWTIYLRTLPAPAYASIVGTLAEKTVSAFVAITLIIIANILINGMILSIPMTLYVVLAALAGGIPMGLLGVAFGYKLSPESGRSVFVFSNLILLFSSFAIPAHGAWLYLRMIVPGYHWADIVMSQYTPNESTLMPWLWMMLYTALFYALALWAYRSRRNLRRD